jgi:hypothetical protein
MGASAAMCAATVLSRSCLSWVIRDEQVEAARLVYVCFALESGQLGRRLFRVRFVPEADSCSACNNASLLDHLIRHLPDPIENGESPNSLHK